MQTQLHGPDPAFSSWIFILVCLSVIDLTIGPLDLLLPLNVDPA